MFPTILHHRNHTRGEIVNVFASSAVDLENEVNGNLLAIPLNVLRFAASDYPFGIFHLFLLRYVCFNHVRGAFFFNITLEKYNISMNQHAIVPCLKFIPKG
jgi:hypothetical protein